MRAGGNDKVHAFTNLLLTGGDDITGTDAQDEFILQTIGDAAQKVVNNESVTASTETQKHKLLIIQLQLTLVVVQLKSPQFPP